jgi:hypothetical protein
METRAAPGTPSSRARPAATHLSLVVAVSQEGQDACQGCCALPRAGHHGQRAQAIGQLPHLTDGNGWCNGRQHMSGCGIQDRDDAKSGCQRVATAHAWAGSVACWNTRKQHTQQRAASTSKPGTCCALSPLSSSALTGHAPGGLLAASAASASSRPSRPPRSDSLAADSPGVVSTAAKALLVAGAASAGCGGAGAGGAWKPGPAGPGGERGGPGEAGAEDAGVLCAVEQLLCASSCWGGPAMPITAW